MDFIRLLAQFEIISLDFLFDIVSEEEYYPLIEDLISENICEFVTPEADMLRLIDVVRDYIKRNRLNISDRYTDKMKQHVKEFLADEDMSNRDASDYIYSLKEALMSGEAIDPARLMPSHFLRCMKDLYQQRKSLARLISLADQVLAKERFLDIRVAQDIRYYLCLALARSRDSRVLKEVQSIKGDEHNFILGYYYRLEGRHKEAIDRLTAILDAPYVGQRASRELVQVYLQTENYEEALALAKRNYESNRGNQYHIQAYFHCLLNSDNFYENTDTLSRLVKELQAIGSQLSLQMAAIAEAEYCDRCENDGIKAMDKINDAIAAYPDITYPLLTKFDIALRRRNVKEMESAHSALQELSKRISTSSFSLQKQSAFLVAAKGNVDAALKILMPAMSRYPDSAKLKAESIIRDLATVGMGRSGT
jgi:tetratricopeptide (TPR) repeat protein